MRCIVTEIQNGAVGHFQHDQPPDLLWSSDNGNP